MIVRYEQNRKGVWIMKKRNRALIRIISLLLLISMTACVRPKPDKNPGGSIDMSKVSDLTVNTGKMPLKLWYDEQAPFINECSPEASMMAGQDIGWQNWSIPLGNGFVGANVFGRVETERVQITEKTLSNPWQIVKTVNGVTSWPQVAGLNNFSETYIDFDHKSSGVSSYRRELDLRTAIASTRYDYNGATYNREYFVSYPDNALVIYLDAENGPLSFTLRPTIPFEQSYMNDPGDGLSKTGTVTSSVEYGVGCIELSGTLGYYGVDFAGFYRVYTDGGRITADTVDNKYTDSDGTVKVDKDGVIRVEGARKAIIVATFGTDYELCSENFENGQYSHNKQTAKIGLEFARDKVLDQLYYTTDEISDMSIDEAYAYLKERHLDDYQNLFDRVDLDLDCNPADLELTTDKLLQKYNSGIHSSYLEALLFQYGRYLIIASSREGALPANLQGAWNCYNTPAWSSGYWSNINIQMNYWHVFSTNLAETFIPYVDYTQAYMPVAEQHADDLIRTHNPDVYNKDGGNGWTMGVSGNPFFFNGDRSCGNLGLLTQLFYEYYRYTNDEEVLKTVYEILANAARFVTKCVKNYDGKYLVEYCDSPEMYVDGAWYYTTGTTYAQTLAYINNYAALQCAKDLGIDLDNLPKEYSILGTIMDQIDKYDPINVGLSGQIKEFREEDYYGSLGNPNHRHISQLVGLFPGNIINSGTDAWMDAALVSLAGRNDGLTDWPSGTTATNEASIVAWAWAHKQAMYARAGEGDLAQQMLAGNLRNSTLENLLMVCGKIFQIEASSGTTAAIAEMLLQSDEEFIEILPAIPTNWDKGAYTGLVARGNYEVSVAWEDGVATKINLFAKLGGEVSIKYNGFSNVEVYNSKGEKIGYTLSNDGILTFDTAVGDRYYIGGFKKVEKLEKPATLDFDRINYSDFNLRWNKVDGAEKYNVYVAYENDPSYTLVGTTANNSYVLTVADGKQNVRKTFAVSAVGKNGVESKRAICYSNPVSLDLEVYSVLWKVEGGKLVASADASDSAGSVRLYERSAKGFALLAEEKGLSISLSYDASKSYALSVVSKYTSAESEIIPLTLENNADNILNGKDITFENNRANVDLGKVYSLNELRFYINTSSFEGNSLKVERLYKGEWHVVADCKTASEVNSYLSDGCLVFDLEGGRAHKIRVTLDVPVDFEAITLSGSVVDGEAVKYDNVFAGKHFSATSATAGNIYSASYGYQTLTDGVIYEEYSGRYSSKQNGGRIEATLELGDAYNLSELKIYLYKDGLSKFGTGLEIQAYFGGKWTTLVECSSNAELEKYLVDNAGGVGDWLIFDLGDSYASKVKFTIPGQTNSGWTTFYEIECLGTPSTVTEPEAEPDPDADPDRIENIFAGKEFVPTAEAKAQVLTASWFQGGGYETLTDGNRFEEQVGRFSTLMNNTTAFMDATLDLGGSYELGSLRFYLYDTKTSITEESKKGSIGRDILIQVYADGKWTNVVSCLDNAALCEYLVINEGLNNDYLEFDLGGIKAERIRFYISGSLSSSGITFQEIECSGKAAK